MSGEAPQQPPNEMTSHAWFLETLSRAQIPSDEVQPGTLEQRLLAEPAAARDVVICPHWRHPWRVMSWG